MAGPASRAASGEYLDLESPTQLRRRGPAVPYATLDLESRIGVWATHSAPIIFQLLTPQQQQLQRSTEPDEANPNPTPQANQTCKKPPHRGEAEECVS